jgi:syntaxin-binding protein 1
MGVEAVYLLTPTSQNVDRVIADFSMGRRTYKAAHLFFIDGELQIARFYHRSGQELT